MDSKLIKAFVFNRIVLGILLSTCFLITGLDLYIDASQASLIRAAVLQTVKTNYSLLSALTTKEISLESLRKQEEISIDVLTPDSLKDDFQKRAFFSLKENPEEPFFQLEERPHLVLRYAIYTADGIREFKVPLNSLEAVVKRSSFLTFCVFLILGIVAAVSLSVFFGFWRRSTEKLIEVHQEALDNQRRLTSSYERFFPRQFLHFLQKKSVLDIHLGDQAEKKMAILFADIRNFTALTEKKTPAESFQFLNEYLKEAAPIIRKNEGFIDKYFGDGILALFDRADDALRAILKISERLRESLQKVKDPSQAIQEIRVGGHFGSLIVGTVGEEERMDGTVISDSVNATSRLEELNKIYQTHILVSESFINNLQAKESFKIRFVDHICVMGKQESLRIFEVFNMDSEEVIEKKEKMEKEFNQAIECYTAKNFKEALNLFLQCRQIYPEDFVVNLFIGRTEKLILEPPDENWTPIVKLNYKDSF